MKGRNRTSDIHNLCSEPQCLLSVVFSAGSYPISSIVTSQKKNQPKTNKHTLLHCLFCTGPPFYSLIYGFLGSKLLLLRVHFFFLLIPPRVSSGKNWKGTYKTRVRSCNSKQWNTPEPIWSLSYIHSQRRERPFRITEWLRLEGTVFWSNPLAQAGSPKAGRPVPRSDSFWMSVSKDGHTTTSSGNLCQCLVTCQVFPDVQTEPPVLQFVPIASGPVTGHHWKVPGSICFTLSLQVFICIDEIRPEPSLLQAEQSQLSWPFLTVQVLQSLDNLSGPLLDSFQ